MSDDRIQRHVDQLSWQLDSWSTIEIEVELRFVNKAKQSASEFGSYVLQAHYIETATGRRMFRETISADDGGMHETINYSDGTLAAQHLKREGSSSTDQISIQRAFGVEGSGQSHRIDPLNAFFVGLKPLPEALPSSSFLGQGRQMSRDCDRFLFAQISDPSNPLQLVYWIDQETSIPLRIERFKDEEARLQDRPISVWSAISIADHGGNPLPKTFSTVGYLPKASGQPQVRYQLDGTLKAVHYNRTYADSIFWPTPSANTTTLDYVKGSVSSPEQHSQMPVPPGVGPILAKEPWGWPSTGSLFTVFGLLLILAAGVFWRRSSH